MSFEKWKKVVSLINLKVMKTRNDCEIACDCVKCANVVLHVRLCKEIEFSLRILLIIVHVDRRRWRAHQLTYDFKRCLLFRKCLRFFEWESSFGAYVCHIGGLGAPWRPAILCVCVIRPSGAITYSYLQVPPDTARQPSFVLDKGFGKLFSPHNNIENNMERMKINSFQIEYTFHEQFSTTAVFFLITSNKVNSDCLTAKFIFDQKRVYRSLTWAISIAEMRKEIRQTKLLLPTNTATVQPSLTFSCP